MPLPTDPQSKQKLVRMVQALMKVPPPRRRQIWEAEKARRVKIHQEDPKAKNTTPG